MICRADSLARRARLKGVVQHSLAVVLVFAALSAIGVARDNIVGAGFLPNPIDPSVSLADVERGVGAIYRVPEISAARLEKELKAGQVALFDVRERNEFETGHLAGAVQVEPGTDAGAFLAKHGATLGGRVVVFYCSVGMRSGAILKRLRGAVAAYRPAAVYNLRGGIFRWFAEGRPIVNKDGASDRIHPFDAAWGKLLQRTLARTP